MPKTIKEQIEDCYNRLADLLDPTTFVYQPGAQEIQDEIEKLQSKCQHHFINGQCEICGKEQD